MAVHLMFLLMICVFHLSSAVIYRVDTNTAEYIGREFGLQSPINLNGSSFLGIPYAEPPIGARRFSKPVLKEVTGIFNASEYGPSCMQLPIVLAAGPPPNADSSEDCLTLNIFVPENASTSGPKAVMLWIYGGGFVVGKSNTYPAQYLTLVGDVIVVTVNYRVDVFGFLSTGDSVAPGNWGLWDQQMAILWVHRNIKYFGGDANRVTIFGESAGGASVTFQSLYGGNSGLFQRAVAESGSLAAAWSTNSKVPDNTRRLAIFLECDVTSSQSSVDCLRSKSTFELLNASVAMAELPTPFPFLPVKDNAFVTYEPHTIFDSESRETLPLFGELDYLIGVNDYDGLVMSGEFGSPNPKLNFSADYLRNVALPLLFKSIDTNPYMEQLQKTLIAHQYRSYDDRQSTANREAILKLYTDYYFVVPGLKSATKHSRITRDKRTWLYKFSHHSPNSVPFITGANHYDEVQYVFGWVIQAGLRNSSEAFPKDDRDISEKMIKYWTNFAKYANPNGNKSYIDEDLLAPWPPYYEDEEYLEFGATYNDIRSDDHMYGDRVAFWTELLPSLELPETKDCTDTSSCSLCHSAFFLNILCLVLVLYAKY